MLSIPSKWRLPGITKISMLMSISLLLIQNVVIATSRSRGYRTSETHLNPLSIKNTGFMENSEATSKLQSPGAIRKRDVVMGPRTSFTKSWEYRNPGISLDQCSFSQVVVTQSSDSNMPNGMPIFQVTIINNCLTCSMKSIHISCGDWSSATGVDPSIFMKLSFNDCLVSNGSPLAPMKSVFFEYSNSFAYPMYMKNSVPCSC